MRQSGISAALRAFMLFLILAAAAHGAKSADDYVHGTGAKYIQGRLQEAGVEVEEGLRRFPGDARLKALAAQLKQMKDQQKKDQGGQDSPGGDQNQDKQDKPDSSGQGKQDGEKDDQKKKDEEKAKEEEAKNQEREKDKEKGGEDPQAQKPQPEEAKEGDSSGQAPAPAKPGEMSKEEAERLLNSYQDDEKREQKDMQKRYRKKVEVEEDW